MEDAKDEALPAPFHEIPQSLAEIYQVRQCLLLSSSHQLSNKNRKLKKKSKKVSVLAGSNSPLTLRGFDGSADGESSICMFYCRCVVVI